MRSLRAVICLVIVIIVSSSSALQAADNHAQGGAIQAQNRKYPKEGTYPVKLTLPQAVQITIQRNPRVSEALAKVMQAQQQAQQVYSDFFPSAQISYEGTWPRYKVGGGFGRPDHVSRWDAGDPYRGFTKSTYPYRTDPYRRFIGTLVITQPIFNGGKVLSDYAAATLGINYSELQVQIDRQDLILAVYTAAYNMELAKRLLEVVNGSIRTLQILRGLNSKLLAAGVVTKTDLLSTESELAVSSVQRRAALTEIERNRALLVNLLSYAPETTINVEVNYKFSPNSYDIPQIYRTAFANRDEIRQANITVQQAIEGIKSAKADLMPAISVKAEGSRTNDDWNIADPEGNNTWALIGSLTWNFNMYRSNSNVKQKIDVERENIATRQKLIQNIAEEVKTAYLDMKKTEGDISDYGKAVDLRTENFNLFQRRYQEGDVSFTEVLIAQQALIESRADYYRSLIGYKVNEAILERRMGILRQ